MFFHAQAVMVNALIAYYTNRRRNSAAAANASSDEIDGIHGEQDLDGEISSSLTITFLSFD